MGQYRLGWQLGVVCCGESAVPIFRRRAALTTSCFQEPLSKGLRLRMRLEGSLLWVLVDKAVELDTQLTGLSLSFESLFSPTSTLTLQPRFVTLLYISQWLFSG